MKKLILLLIIIGITTAGCKTNIRVESDPQPDPQPQPQPDPQPEPQPDPEPQPEILPEYGMYQCDRDLVKVTMQTEIKICYDNRLIAAVMVEYTLSSDYIDTLNIKKRPRFKKDSSVRNGAVTRDYTHSGFDRGHLAPDASFDYDQNDLNQVYFMTNIVPMDPTVNRYMWSDLEEYARIKTREYGAIHVLNGVVFRATPQRLTGQHKVAIPESFWKRLRSIDGTFDECYSYDNHVVDFDHDNLLLHKVECSVIQ
jgi:endonuclease G